MGTSVQIDVPVPGRERIEAEARSSGLSQSGAVSAKAVRRRRRELWVSAGVLLAAIGTAMVLVAQWPSEEAGTNLSPTVLRGLLLALSVALVGYAAEREHHLRRLARLLEREQTLNATLASRLREASALSTLSRAIDFSVLDLEEVMEVSLGSAVDLMGASWGCLVLMDPSGEAERVAVRGEALEGFAGGDEDLARAVASSSEGTVAANGSMAVPLLRAGEGIGAMILRTGTDRPFEEQDLQVLQTHAENIAAWVELARRYEEQAGRAREFAWWSGPGEGGEDEALRGPVTSILGTVFALRGMDLSEREREQMLADIERQGRRLLREIDARAGHA